MMVRSDEHMVVLCTAPDAQTADRLARALVESHLAACVSRIEGVRSVYIWEGETKDDTEVQLVIKTHRDRLDAIGAFMKAEHPYDTPELVALPVMYGSADYLAFVDAATSAR